MRLSFYIRRLPMAIRTFHYPDAGRYPKVGELPTQITTSWLHQRKTAIITGSCPKHQYGYCQTPFVRSHPMIQQRSVQPSRQGLRQPKQKNGGHPDYRVNAARITRGVTIYETRVYLS